MQVTERRSAGATIVAISGKVVGDSSQELRAYVSRLVERLADERALRLAFDLSDTQFLDSSGLGALVRAQIATAERGGKMVLVNPHEHIRRLLTVARIEHLLPICDGEASALKALAVADGEGDAANPKAGEGSSG
ncbi:STAS domain-containing protein [Candidatus Poribacteria bacterium]|nr:STAS domain-containing protein [Candidatus Poribacteria bacterium]